MSSTTGKSKMHATCKPTQSGNRRRRLMALLEEMEPEDLVENEEEEDVDLEQALENEILEDDDDELHELLGN